MMSYTDFFIPALILIRAFVNFAGAYKLIADKGELYYIYKYDWKEHIGTIFFLILGLIFLIMMSKNKVDFNSLYIYEKYYNSPLDLFDMAYYDSLYESLVDTNKVDLNALKAMKRTLYLIPSLLALFMSFTSDFAPTIFSAGIYSNGIFDGKKYYTYEDTKSYKIQDEGDKPSLTLILKKIGLFSREHKEVVIPIQKEDVDEIINYLRHEIRDESTFEKNVHSTV